jgi:phosphoglycerol geranylgeranyltransferase
MKNTWKMLYRNWIEAKKKGEKILAILLDPDKVDFDELDNLAAKIERAGAQIILVGGSRVFTDRMDELVLELKDRTSIPVVLFPGNPSQISLHADGILFLSLLSGRNPDYLIGHHVKAAPVLAASQLEIIPTGYILVDGGKQTAVARVSNTQPLDAQEEIINTAIAGQLLGQQLIYLEAGSGAAKSVSTEIVKQVAMQLEIPLIVGGGIRSKSKINEIFEAGADIVVIGTAFEENLNFFEQP